MPTPGQPGYDSGGSFGHRGRDGGHLHVHVRHRAARRASRPRRTHTVGAQVERTLETADAGREPALRLRAGRRPVDDGRQVTTTAQCNGCHDPLAEHGGGRREVGSASSATPTSASIPRAATRSSCSSMIHRIHRGKDLPTVDRRVPSARSTRSATARTSSPRRSTPAPAARSTAPCTSEGGLRRRQAAPARRPRASASRRTSGTAAKCHTEGATADDTSAKAVRTLACTGCHDNMNPGETPTERAAPGAGHAAGAQPEAFCATLCHLR